MTLNKGYDEIMDRINVTEEMRGRILDSVKDNDFVNQESCKVIKFQTKKIYMVIAACIVVILVSMISIPSLIQNEKDNTPDVIQLANGIVEVGSSKELSDLIGFEVKDIENLPFKPVQCAYTVHWNELAQILYTGDEQTMAFRKSQGNEDNSGDFNVYTNIIEIQINQQSITLKGSDNSYNLATWSEGDYSYSIRSSISLTEEEWESIIILLLL